ncbi:MAG: hypothetical protein JWP12_3237 [Bacteroidetes bacterium]|nr:hypothetical protein [Bacteroidota bacterium]
MNSFHPIPKETGSSSQILIQPQLEIGKEDDDVHEKEAEHVADKVMRMPDSEDEKNKMPESKPLLQKMPESPALMKMPESIARPKMRESGLQIRKQSMNSSAGISAPQKVEKGINNSKGSGQSLSPGLQQEMGNKMNADFSDVKIHSDENAAEMNKEVSAKAFTHGNDIYFNNGQYNPASNQGKHLLAHELTHTVQQENEINRKIQRSALASWQDATPTDRRDLFNSEADKGAKKNMKKLLDAGQPQEAEKLLPVIDKIMMITANYHYQKEMPSGNSNPPFVVDDAVIKEVQKKLRMTDSSPAFWEHIKWIDGNNKLRDIGVKFNINFILQEIPKAEQKMDYDGMPENLNDVDAVKKNPWDNKFTFTTIDEIQDMTYYDLQSFVANNVLDKIKFITNSKQIDEVEYTAPDGKVITYENSQLWEIKKVIRQEWELQKKGNGIGNNTLGKGDRKEVTVDPLKSAPLSQTYPRYQKYSNHEGKDDPYYDTVKDEFKKTDTKKFDKESDKPARNKMIASIIVHEIGHNIGMGHADFGIMNSSTEVVNYNQKQVDLNPETKYGSGNSISIMGDPRILALQNDLTLSDNQVMRENIQKLVNRVRVMTEALGQRNSTTGVLEDVSSLWSQKINALLAALKKPDLPSIFADPFLVSLLAIPINVTSLPKTDVPVMETVIKNGFLMTLADWSLLTKPTQDKIISDTTKEYADGKTSGSGHTFFESKAEMNTF